MISIIHVVPHARTLRPESLDNTTRQILNHYPIKTIETRDMATIKIPTHTHHIITVTTTVALWTHTKLPTTLMQIVLDHRNWNGNT